VQHTVGFIAGDLSSCGMTSFIPRFSDEVEDAGEFNFHVFPVQSLRENRLVGFETLPDFLINPTY
jgi:hypothetical protein